MHIIIGFFVTLWSIVTIIGFAITAGISIWAFTSSKIDTKGGWIFGIFAMLILSLYFVLQNVRF